MNYSLLQQLISRLEPFEQQDPKGELEDFVIWLNNSLFGGGRGDSGHQDLLIAFKIMFLNKALKRLAKVILTDSKVFSVDEYSFLLHLEHQESFRKMEIIELHNLEAPTGIEIIKRLLKNRLIEEFPDEQDRRAKRIRMTQRGREELLWLKPRLEKMFQDFTHPLALEEQIHLSGILNKLM